MKKLIATAVVAAAAYGAFAIETGVRFENLERDTTTVAALNTATGNYWSEPQDATNTYNVVAMDGYDGTHPATFVGDPTNALSVKTTFGKPLSFAVNADGTASQIGDGIYFDSLIKFTVCEEAPEANLYGDAKIALWLQEQYDEDDNITGTNLVVRAGKLSYSDALQVVATDYVCDLVEGDFADSWHRVTIKTIADITDGDGVPGFAIYIDGELKSSSASAAKWDESFTYTLSEVAENLDDLDALFPSLKQSGDEKSTVACAQFDGTGSVNELIFTATAPSFASNEQYLDPKFTLQLGEEGEPTPFKTVAAAIDAINKLDVAGDYTLKLLENLNISESLVFDNADESITIVLDLNGKTIINTAADTTYAITVTGGTTLTITDSSANKDGMIVSVTEEELGAILLGQDAVFTLAAGTINGYINGDAGSTSYTGGSVDAATKDNAYNEATGYKFVRNVETGFWDVVPLGSFTVTFVLDNGSANVVTNDVLEGTKASELQDVPVPEKAGFTFNGWSPALDTTTITSNTTFTAQWTENDSTTEIPAGEESVEVEVNIPEDATPEVQAEILSNAVESVTVAAPSSVVTTDEQKADYQSLFTKTAVYNAETRKWIVTAKINEDVENAVAESAVDVLNGDADTGTISIPRGLFYKITTMTELGGLETTVGRDVSTGSAISVPKPGNKSGFIKILIGTQAYAE